MLFTFSCDSCGVETSTHRFFECFNRPKGHSKEPKVANIDLDFLDDFDLDDSRPPQGKSDQPLWRRKRNDFYAGKVTLADATFREDWKRTNLIFMSDDANAAGHDVIELSFGEKAGKPLAIVLRKLGLDVKVIKKFLQSPTEKGFAPVAKALSGCESFVVQIPYVVQGKYHQQTIYTEAGWQGLLATYGGEPPTPEDLGYSPQSSDDDDLY